MAENYDIMEEPKETKKSIFGSSKKSKIINGVSLILLVAVVIWCALYKLGVIGAM